MHTMQGRISNQDCDGGEGKIALDLRNVWCMVVVCVGVVYSTDTCVWMLYVLG